MPDYNKLSVLFKERLEKLTDEEIELYFPNDTKPKGWLSIDEYLPMFLAKDVAKGGTQYKVRDINGNEFFNMVSDHVTWYYDAKNNGITHWFGSVN